MNLLIVEDQQVMRTLLREFLQAHSPDWIIHEAGSPGEALEACRRHRPRVILMDVNLREGNGIELTASVKLLLPKSDVIIVSQHSTPTYIERAYAAGASDYITKEKVYRKLLPAIDGVLRPGCAPVTGNREDQP